VRYPSKFDYLDFILSVIVLTVIISVIFLLFFRFVTFDWISGLGPFFPYLLVGVVFLAVSLNAINPRTYISYFEVQTDQMVVAYVPFRRIPDTIFKFSEIEEVRKIKSGKRKKVYEIVMRDEEIECIDLSFVPEDEFVRLLEDKSVSFVI